MIKFKGIRETVRDFNNCDHAIIYFDIATREVWCNEYCSANSWTQYDDPDIYMLNLDYFFSLTSMLGINTPDDLTCRTLNKILNIYLDLLKK